MDPSRKLIGISLRIIKAENYDESRDALSHDWSSFLGKLGFYPILIPNAFPDIASFLKNLKLDGLILSGGDNIGDTPIRDETEKKIIEYAIKNEIPIFGVCRGMQILNQYFGGTIIQTNSQEHINKHHKLEVVNSKFSNFLNSTIIVNSFHKNLIKKETLGKDLQAFANCNSDNTIEGFFHRNYPILGVMWHPEREPNQLNELIIKNLFSTKKFWS